MVQGRLKRRANAVTHLSKNTSTMKKYLIGFAIFFVYYLVAENLKNKMAVIQKLTNVGA